MNTESPRIRALLAGGAALIAFGITIPATAAPEHVGKPEGGTVGQAHVKADPKGQSEGDRNNGFTCDGNGGVGSGNPALDPSCDDGTDGSTGTGSGSGTGDSDWTTPGT